MSMAITSARGQTERPQQPGVSDAPEPELEVSKGTKIAAGIGVGGIAMVFAGGWAASTPKLGSAGILGVMGGLFAVMAGGMAAWMNLNGDEDRSIETGASTVLDAWNGQSQLPKWMPNDQVLEHVMRDRGGWQVRADETDSPDDVAAMGASILDRNLELDDVGSVIHAVNERYDTEYLDTSQIVTAAMESDRPVNEVIHIVKYADEHYDDDVDTAVTLLGSNLTTAQILTGRS